MFPSREAAAVPRGLARALTRDARFVSLAAAVFVVVTMHTVNQQWTGDFWEHAAVIRELAARPWAPQHPLFAVDAPHPFFSPYSLVVALAARSFTAEPTTALAVAGLASLVLILVAIGLFARAWLGERAGFYLLLFTLALWGVEPFRYSGFLHLNALGFVAAYPSTIALALTLLALVALAQYRDTGRARWVAAIAVIAPIVLLTHPITSIVLAIGLTTFSLRPAEGEPLRYVALAVIVAAASLGALALWPYYPWFELIRSGSATYATPNLGMYDAPLQRVWPALIAVPLVVRRLIRDPLDGLSLFIVVLALTYWLGWAIQNGPLGRVLAALVLGLHCVLASEVAALEPRPGAATARSTLLRIVVVVLLAVWGAVNARSALVRAVPLSLLPGRIASDPRLERVPDLYRPLESYVGQDDVVMADINVSRYLPAFAGKVVGFIDPEAFVRDERERREAVFAFFSGDATVGEREALIRRYGVKFIAADEKSPLGAALLHSLAGLGDPASDAGRIALIRVRCCQSDQAR